MSVVAHACVPALCVRGKTDSLHGDAQLGKLLCFLCALLPIQLIAGVLHDRTLLYQTTVLSCCMEGANQRVMQAYHVLDLMFINKSQFLSFHVSSLS